MVGKKEWKISLGIKTKICDQKDNSSFENLLLKKWCDTIYDFESWILKRFEVESKSVLKTKFDVMKKIV